MASYNRSTLRCKALQAPVIVTYRSQDDLVIMPTEQYAVLTTFGPRRDGYRDEVTGRRASDQPFPCAGLLTVAKLKAE